VLKLKHYMTSIASIQDLDTRLDLSFSKHVITDSEYTLWENVEVNGTWQTYFLGKCFEVADEDLETLAIIILWDLSLPKPTNIPENVHFFHCDCNSTGLEDVAKLSKKNGLWFFYAPKDVEGTVKPEKWLENLLDPSTNITKKRNITGMVRTVGTTYYLRDVFGMFNTGLKNALEMVGIDTGIKSEMKDRDMSRMDLIMKENPNESLEYLLADVSSLKEAVLLRVDQINEINESVHPGIEPYTIHDIPRSSGALVWDTFLRWLVLENRELYLAALYLSDSNNNKAWVELKKIKEGLDSLPEVNIESPTDEDFDNVNFIKKATKTIENSGSVNGFGLCGISNFPLLTKNTGLLGAIVQGGRCNNEEPYENPYHNFITDVYDPDLQGCYGTKLREYDYPVGVPSLFEYAKDDTPKTLGEVLSELESELVPNLYTIVVEGELDFTQDLVCSKLGITTTTVVRSIMGDFEKFDDSGSWGMEVEKAHIVGDFLLQTQEIVNGIITHKVLDTIRKVSTSQELKSWMNLKVQCVVYYPKSLELSIPEFIDTVKNPKTRGGKYAKVGDIRTRVWTRLPLEGFIGKYINQRMIWKKKKGDKTLEESEKHRYDLLQNGVKTFINTLYGNTAAPYFPIGNTVIANNITAAARVGVWQMSKALLLKQTITDGGLGSNLECLSWKPNARRPGFQVLADRQKLKSYRYLSVSKLVDVEDFVGWVRDYNDLDTIVKNQVDTFWEAYNLSFDFEIECKSANTGQYAIYFNSGDY